MIDQIRIQVLSGKGGRGSVSGRRDKSTSRGGPDGGNGGDGGSVSIVADSGLVTLAHYSETSRFAAGAGGDGTSSRRHGSKGKDVVVKVPVGTEVWLDEGRGELLADLLYDGHRVVVADGGRGGRGNTAFTTSVNRFPLLAEAGEDGVSLRLRLELKVLADVGIVGAPNAGKSSLLASISRARPRIAGYPFTTLEPVLGIVEHKGTGFVAADIPGLVEGAHEGVGLGADFLRHVERTRILVHVVDGSAEDPVGEWARVQRELSLFRDGLADRPQIVALNKIDLPEVEPRVGELVERLGQDGRGVIPVSAATGRNVGSLLDAVLEILNRARQTERAERTPPPPPILRPRPAEGRPRVSVKGGVFVVEMPSAARVAALVDQASLEARLQLHAYLRRVGVLQALEDAGVSSGDTVRLGRTEWEWQ